MPPHIPPLAWHRFQPAGPPPAARMGAAAAVVDACAWGSSVVVVHGGLSAQRYATTSVALLLDGDAWHAPETRGAAPAPRAFHAAAPLGVSRVAVFGGHAFLNGKVVKHDTLYILDVDTLTWHAAATRRGPRPPARDFCALAPLSATKLVLFGGLDATEKRLGDVWVYDADTDAWAEVAAGPRPSPRYGHTLTPAWGPGRVFLFGGETATGPSSELWMVRAAADDGDGDGGGLVWVKLDLPGPAPAPRKGHAAACVGNWIVFVGGRTADGGWLRGRTQTLCADAGAVVRAADGVGWAAVPLVGPAPTPREFACAVPIPGGRLLLTGGGDGSVVLGPEADATLVAHAAFSGAEGGAVLARASSSRPALPADAGPPTPLSVSSSASSGWDERSHRFPGAWWGGCAAVVDLRARVGLPAARGPGLSRFSSAGGAAPSPLPSDRSLADIAAGQPGDLSRRDVAAALAHLSTSFRGGLCPAAPLDAGRMTGRGRFVHATVDDLRLSDLEALVGEVRAVVW